MAQSDENITRTRRRLLDTYPSSTFGFWEIVGEDPNCDLGGPHYSPLLTRVEGTYLDAVELALSLDGFWSWGYGGDIRKVEFNKLSPGSAARLHGLREKREQLEDELKKIDAELHRYSAKH